MFALHGDFSHQRILTENVLTTAKKEPDSKASNDREKHKTGSREGLRWEGNRPGLDQMA